MAQGPPDRDELADQITEQALQLLYTARQDIAEAAEERVGDRALEQAQFHVLDAIAVLRDVAGAIPTPSWDIALERPARGRSAARREEFERRCASHRDDRLRWMAARRAREDERLRRQARRIERAAAGDGSA